MRRATHTDPFLRTVVVAAGLSAVGALGFIALSAVAPASTALRLALAIVAGLAVADTLRHARSGRASAFVAWLAAAIVTGFSDLSLVAFASIHVAVLWSLTVLLRSRSLLAALGEGVLHVLALAAAVATTAHAGSLFLALWSFFLALATGRLALRQVADGIPRSSGDRSEDAVFDRAAHSAEAALRRLARRP